MIKFEEFRELLKKDRSVRRFDQTKVIEYEALKRLVGLTRLCASGRNLQPLRYRIVCSQQECRSLFPHLAWAGYYRDWDGPEEGERPVAYLVQCLDTGLTANPLCDEGLHLQAMTLGAATMGIAACIVKAFDREGVSAALSLPEGMDPRYVLALGYPAEDVRLVDVADGDIRYYRDEKGVHCVPKRSIEDLILPGNE